MSGLPSLRIGLSQRRAIRQTHRAVPHSHGPNRAAGESYELDRTNDFIPRHTLCGADASLAGSRSMDAKVGFGSTDRTHRSPSTIAALAAPHARDASSLETAL